MAKAVFCVALSASTLLSGLAVADGSVSQTGMGMGTRGPIAPFEAIVRQFNASGERFRIDTHCQSACTLFLGIRNVCITPSAELAFHAGGIGTISPYVTSRMLASYNGRLRSYLRAGHYMETFDFHVISGRDMIARFGYRACP